MTAKDVKRNEILQLLAAGKITASEAAELLSGMSQVDEGSANAPAVEKQPLPEGLDEFIKIEPDPGMEYNKTAGYQEPSWLRVRVKDLSSGRNKVSVNIPMRLMRFGLAVGSHFAPELQEFDWDELTGLLGSERGLLVDVQDEEDGEHVQIFVD